MTFVYIVRCNFTAPEREQAWNDWYSGPKIQQMLAKPYFLTCQRFRRAAGRGRDYVALWTMQSPQALKTPEYLSQWGFSEWTPLIADWSRDLFDGGATPETAFAVAPGGALHVIAFDGRSEHEARQAARAKSEMLWLPVAGLDRHTPLIGLQPLPAPRAMGDGGDPAMQEAIYRPICELYRASRSAG